MLCTDWKEYLERYKLLARECKICIVPGTLVQNMGEKEEGKPVLHNVAYFIDDKGIVRGSYQKKNL